MADRAGGMPVSGRRPTKAYYVERRIENVTVALVYADSAEDAKRRSRNGEQEYSENTGQDRFLGYRRVRRAPDEDRNA